MVDHLSLRQQCETVKETEDGVARLVDRENDNLLILGLTQPIEGNVLAVTL